MSDRGLTLNGLWFSYGAERVLGGVYLRVEPGDICGLIGRNGCGKSTALQVAAGQLKADSGIVEFDGRRFAGKRLHRRFAMLAYLPQKPMLPPSMRVSSLAHLTGLADHPVVTRTASQRVRELSTGEERLLTLLFVLSLDRPYYLLDEPFSGVEPLFIEDMMRAIRGAADRGAGVLLTDHYHQYVTALCSRAYLMENRQCRELQAPFAASLRDVGYLPPLT